MLMECHDHLNHFQSFLILLLLAPSRIPKIPEEKNSTVTSENESTKCFITAQLPNFWNNMPCHKFLTTLTSTIKLTFTCSKSTIEALEKGVKQLPSQQKFQVNIKNSRTTSFCCFFWFTLNIFHTFFAVSIVEFGQVNVNWD